MSDPSATFPHVTVVVPCYNRASTARQAIDSVLAQDYPAFDVIAVDDQSTDDTLSVLRRIDDPRFAVMENTEPKGVSGARNAGSKAAKGSWIAYQDSDDLWRPGKLSRQMARLAGSSFVAGFCSMEILDEATGQTTGRIPRDGLYQPGTPLLHTLLFENLISTQTLIIRGDVFREIGGFDCSLPALVDWDLVLRAAQAGPIDFLDEELVEQRMSDNSITRSSRNRLIAQEAILAKHHALLASHPKALAHHHHRIAGAHRQVSDYGRALGHAWRACAAAPMNWKYWPAALYSTARAPFQRGR
ncbi:glycosyltransferase [Tropicimonas sp. TH_r6]|uniref:glycosyltransferase family 2 protein n=1 Tax=Tropicimonas sp. TH_r6 TaxID=3082085 RepID=UPI0029544DAB|nr:glycosyltransferase [Tropicimonas sp. TH_r6]MDV7145539.1 glycosyltransferase [Tropicimonas sp. TH_r6]